MNPVGCCRSGARRWRTGRATCWSCSTTCCSRRAWTTGNASDRSASRHVALDSHGFGRTVPCFHSVVRVDQGASNVQSRLVCFCLQTCHLRRQATCTNPLPSQMVMETKSSLESGIIGSGHSFAGGAAGRAARRRRLGAGADERPRVPGAHPQPGGARRLRLARCPGGPGIHQAR